MTLLDKSLAAITTLRDEHVSPMDRYESAMNTIVGMELSSLSEDVRDAFEYHACRCNELMKPYGIESFEDYVRVSASDGDQVISHALQMMTVIRDGEIETLMQRLHHHEGRLPVAEIETIRRHPEVFKPILLQEVLDHVQWWIEHPGAKKKDDSYSNVPFFTFVIAFELNWKDAVSLIVDSLHLPGEAPFDLYGDIVHEYVSRFLAHFLGDETDRIENLIRDGNANEYVRWSACKAFAYLVRDHKMAAEEAVDRLVNLFFDCRVMGDNNRPGAGHSFELSAGLLDVIEQLGGASDEIIPNTDEVWDFVDESIVQRESFYQGDSIDEQLHAPTHMGDCLSELKNWASFAPKRRPTPTPPPPKPKDRVQPASVARHQPTTVPTARPSSTSRVGRNELCPCGSGKKYKKCCLRT